MKILIINTFFEGTSTGKIATGLYKKLKENGHQCKLLYGCGVESGNPDFIKIATPFDIRLQWLHNQCTGIHGHFAPFVMKRVFKVIEEFQPDVVQLYNLHFYYLDIYRLFEYLKCKQIATVYGMLDEYPYLGYCCYSYDCDRFKEGCKECDYKQFRKSYPRNLFRNGSSKTVKLKERAYSNFPNLIFTGPEWVINRAEESYLLTNKRLKIVDEYVENDSIFFPRDTRTLRKELGIPTGKTIILNVAPSNDPRKGVRYYVEMAEKIENEKFVFIHVGYQGKAEELPKNMIPISFVKDQDKLAEFYSLADLFVCTSVADTMPNVCLDALSCGTPIVGFDVTGIPYVAEEPYGRFVQPGDVNALTELVESTVQKSEEITEQCRTYAVKRYSPETYYKNMMDIYCELLGDI